MEPILDNQSDKVGDDKGAEGQADCPGFFHLLKHVCRDEGESLDVEAQADPEAIHVGISILDAGGSGAVITHSAERIWDVWVDGRKKKKSGIAILASGGEVRPNVDMQVFAGHQSHLGSLD